MSCVKYRTATQSYIQWLQGVKQPRPEADHSPPSSIEVNARSYTTTPPHVFMAWYLVKHRTTQHLPHSCIGCDTASVFQHPAQVVCVHRIE